MLSGGHAIIRGLWKMRYLPVPDTRGVGIER